MLFDLLFNWIVNWKGIEGILEMLYLGNILIVGYKNEEVIIKWY